MIEINGIEVEEKRKSINEIELWYNGKVLYTINLEQPILPQVTRFYELLNLFTHGMI